MGSPYVNKTKKSHYRVVKYGSMILLITIILVLTKQIWLNDGYIVFSDLDFGFDDKKYIERILGIFNEGFSSMNFFNLSRLFFILPFYLLSQIFSFVPHFLLKSIIVGVFIISAVGMYKLCEKLLILHFGRFKNSYHYIGLIIPALFYAINPWVILRIQHIFLLPGYAAYPWVLYYFIDLFREYKYEQSDRAIELNIFFFKRSILINENIFMDIKASIKMAFTIAFASASIHYFFFIAITIAVFSVGLLFYNIFKSKKIRTNIIAFLRKHLIMWTITFIFCSYWLVPYVVSMMVTSIEPNNVNVIDTLSMFSRNSNLQNILYLISYWWPMFDYSSHIDTFFWISGGVFLFIIISTSLYRSSRHFYIGLFSFTILSMILLATGVKSQMLAGFNIIVVTKVPIIGHIFRDPNKLVGPMSAFYAILIGFGVDRNLFILKREGFRRALQLGLVLLLIVAHFFYYRPFYEMFTKQYYAAVSLPVEYEEVNKNHVPTDGKVLWMPTMENMILSNGMSNYDWNGADRNVRNQRTFKTVGDFQFYSSSKGGIFQHEGNSGLISYTYTFMQKLLDSTGGQNLDEFISWMGFDEVAFHNDVFYQEKRQKFNKMILDKQKGLDPYYEDDIFTLYKVKEAQSSKFITNRNVLLSKGLFSFLYMMDEKEALGLAPQNSTILWQQSRKQDIELSQEDIIMGDNIWDFTLPFIDEKYFLSPFHKVNSASANTQWAKALVGGNDWQWIQKINGLYNMDFEYDYGHGIAYTYAENKLDLPSYKSGANLDNRIMSIKDILDDFFKADNEEIFDITVFPSVSSNEDVIYGEVHIDNGTNPWQVAKSKMTEVGDLSGGFISIDAMVSGINAGDLHFKVRFYNELNEELKVTYVSRSNHESDYKKSKMYGSTYVPKDAKRMRIDILSSNSTTLKTYFWIHDFNIYDLSNYRVKNILEMNLSEEMLGRSRVFIRTFTSKAGNKLEVKSGEKSVVVDLYSEKNRFEWIDLGVMDITEKNLELVPYEGMTVVNTIIVIPEEKFEDAYSGALKELKGAQVDFSLAPIDYNTYADVPIRGINNQYVYANTINGSLVYINDGYLTKNIDIVRGDYYKFSITGNIPADAKVRVKFIDEDNAEIDLDAIISKDIVARNFDNQYFKIDREINEYYLKPLEHSTEDYQIYKYNFDNIYLKKGRYKVRIEIDAGKENRLKVEEIHVLQDDEIMISQDMINRDDYLLAVSASLLNDSKITSPKNIEKQNVFINPPSRSKLWMIFALNQIPVKKGELLVFRSKGKTEGIKDLHSKLFWMNDEKLLINSQYVEHYNGEFYIIAEAPADGFVQPAFLARSDGEKEGRFEILDGQFYDIRKFGKIEGTILTSDKIVKGPIGDNTKGYLISNEAYHPLWRQKTEPGTPPIMANFIHSAFYTEKKGVETELVILPILQYSYLAFLVISMISYILGIYVLKKIKKILSADILVDKSTW